jgi:hypothetical protein
MNPHRTIRGEPAVNKQGPSDSGEVTPSRPAAPRPLAAPGTRSVLAIALPGLAGLAVLGRTAFYYAATDPLALSIVGLMGTGFCVGIAELIGRARRLAEDGRALQRLPQPATEAAIDAAPEPLRARLRAYLDRMPQPVRGPLFTPYLVGLMVMLGLFGTFLGLFETMSGARHALDASGDVGSLRHSLTAPITGLTRCFGTSAAGVCTSALLGLAAVFLRRSEGQLSAQIARYTTGPLAPLSPLRRQEEALARLAEQGAALPRAAAALERAASDLAGLERVWQSTHVETAQRTMTALESAVSRMRDDLDRAIAASAERTHAAVAPLLVDAASGLAQTARSHLEAIDARVGQLLDERSRADGALGAALQGHVAALGERLEQYLASRRAAEEAQEARAEQRTTTLLAQLDASLAQRRASDDDQARRMGEHLENVIARIDAGLAQRRASDDDQARRMGEHLENVIARIDASLIERRAADAAAAAALEVHAERLGERLQHYLAGREQADEAQAVRLGEHGSRVAAQLDQALAACTEVASQQTRSFTEYVRDLTARLDRDLEARRALEAQHGARLEQLVADLSAAETQRTTMLTSRWSELTDRLESRYAETAARDEERGQVLVETAHALQGQLADTALAVRQRLDASARSEAEQHERIARYVDTLVETTRSISEAAQTHGQAAEAFTRTAEERSREAENLAITCVSELAGELRQTAEAQRDRLEAFERTLLTMHKAAFDSARELLAAQDRSARDTLAGLVDGARDAVAAIQAGGAELFAVTELFARTVERHRESAESWLAQLGTLEAAIDRAGEQAATTALEQHLASTQELFSRQLEFHCELYEQLRQLRGDSEAQSNGSRRESRDNVRA